MTATKPHTELRSIDWVDGAVELIDQTALPERLSILRISDPEEVVEAIRRLAVRGAPSIGVAGALGVALAMRTHPPDRAPDRFAEQVQALRRARPTAVNLARSVDRVVALASGGFEVVLAEALAIRDEEIAACWAMGRQGADLLEQLVGSRPQRLMTICNTGGLAAVERGTALGVIATMFERGLLAEALPVETRPLLQGARLTTWELARMGAPFRLLVDSAGPFLLARGEADAVVVGADRVAANGDTANKVGTYALALGARQAGAPFIVVAPESSVDLVTPAGDAIVIEDRGAEEVTSLRGWPVAPAGTPALNPAFDITPAALITALVTDRRIIRLDQGQKPSPLPPAAGGTHESNGTTEERHA
jgi:methylthioribose-1-phosphate isomerase